MNNYTAHTDARSLQKNFDGNDLTADELIVCIARSLVDRPDDVRVDSVEGCQTTVLELRTAKEDVGKIIGRQGQTAKAMRTILAAAASKTRKRMILEIIE